MLHRCDVRDGEGWRGADRTDEARKRHENHGNRGSSWIAALGQHACRQSPRSSAGTAMLRLLHDRGQAGEFDRRSRLRQRSTRRGVAQGRHRDDRAASQQQKQAAHARSATAKPLYATLARGALLCLDSMAAPHPCPLGILRPELPRLRTARLPRCPLQAILRQVLVLLAHVLTLTLMLTKIRWRHPTVIDVELSSTRATEEDHDAHPLKGTDWNCCAHVRSDGDAAICGGRYV